MRLAIRAMLVTFTLLTLAIELLPADAHGVSSPPAPVSGATVANGWDMTATTRSDPGDTTTGTSATRTYDCGAPLSSAQRTGNGLDPCDEAQDTCKGQATTDATGKPTATMVTQTQNANGTWSTTHVDCVVGAPPPQDPIAAAAKDAFTKLVPKVTIKAAGHDGISLVNLETLYWLDTPATVDLGATALLGQSVRLLATVQTVQWNFGDGESATSQGPGRPFTADDHCATTTCPDWFGHTYLKPNLKVTVSATSTWTGRYSINNGPFIAINGTVTAPASTIPMEVEQSLAVLVPNPGETN